ncbi:lipoyl synthase [Fundidesulfovibrio terrae]|uniref:lipoyl synthase n=1 Tax=Fundidesulfovibrio terrae TaxID=2922866 RepID=UPI001FAFB635|nr:lipoyl synthase [Fundidesulfovibrio terrae]
MPSSKPSCPSRPASPRLPSWLKVKPPMGQAFAGTASVVAGQELHTVCRQARCPNMAECFGKGVATFLILGGVCSRACGFCNITPGSPSPVDPGEPDRVALAANKLGLRYAVITSVTRDDLPDGGAAHFAATIRAVRRELSAAAAGPEAASGAGPGVGVEVLIPDFQGSAEALAVVLDANPSVLNHNLETVPELYSTVRPQAVYARSLELLARAKASGRARVKSGLMLGLGETREQLARVLSDLAGIGCDMVTVGQYLRPSRRNLPVVRYVPPEEFDEVAELGRTLGIPVMYCGPLVRSSHDASSLLAEGRLP